MTQAPQTNRAGGFRAARPVAFGQFRKWVGVQQVALFNAKQHFYKVGAEPEQTYAQESFFIE